MVASISSKMVKRLPFPVIPVRQKTPLWSLLLGLILIGLGAAIAVNSKVSTLSCYRVEGDRVQCQLQETDLIDWNVKQANLGVIKAAEATLDIDYSGERNELFLVTEQTKIQIDFFLKNEDLKEPADRINEFIADKNEEFLEIRKDNRLFGCFFGAMLAFAGLVRLGNFSE